VSPRATGGLRLAWGPSGPVAGGPRPRSRHTLAAWSASPRPGSQETARRLHGFPRPPRYLAGARTGRACLDMGTSGVPELMAFDAWDFNLPVLGQQIEAERRGLTMTFEELQRFARRVHPVICGEFIAAQSPAALPLRTSDAATVGQRAVAAWPRSTARTGSWEVHRTSSTASLGGSTPSMTSPSMTGSARTTDHGRSSSAGTSAGPGETRRSRLQRRRRCHGPRPRSRSRCGLPPGPHRLQGAGRFGRSPSCDVSNNRRWRSPVRPRSTTWAGRPCRRDCLAPNAVAAGFGPTTPAHRPKRARGRNRWDARTCQRAGAGVR
jgi:hypothetical protein